MKQCSKCKEWKSESEFSKCNSRRDGLQRYCKICSVNSVKDYRRTEKGMEVMRKSVIKYHRTEKGMEVSRNSRRRYGQSEKGKIVAKRKRQGLPTRATRAVNNAVKLGKIPHISTLQCARCGNQAEQYHHFKGYDKENWFEIVPLCKHCHITEHHPHLEKNSRCTSAT